MGAIEIAQSIFDQYGIKPCYVVDYPVVSQKKGYEILQSIHMRGGCEIGAHLHPWVNPPFEEEVTVKNMYPGNLPRSLEYKKLKILSQTVQSVFNEAPRIYKAGRYGLGPNSFAILDELGFDIDLSVCPPMDFRGDGGPDYRNTYSQPFWFGKDNASLCIPTSGAFVGMASQFGSQIYTFAQHLIAFRAPGILARTNIVDRLMLSPEGYTQKEHIKLTRYLINQNVRIFTWSFHSPSLVPGFSPYVRSDADLKAFLDSFHRYFDYFFNELGGITTTPTQLHRDLQAYQ